jgi:hypothetical protein
MVKLILKTRGSPTQKEGLEMKITILVSILSLVVLLGTSCLAGVSQEKINKSEETPPAEIQSLTPTPTPVKVVKVYGTPS